MKFCCLVLLLSLINIKGPKEKRVENFHVVSYEKVSPNYRYSGDIIKWNGHLLKVGVYKSEGILFFSLAELEADSLLRESLSISIRRTIGIGRGVIIDKGRRYKAVSYKHKWYLHSGKALKVYIPDKGRISH
ncbi:hypothetical protein [Hoylesella loescheii]|uniref:hypothetical protein n=1 Tax=Hoylesella loescheii TaxID=840 RepID=UPI0028EEE287|nr:hypothetical protein [Hoylesella loescheii]